MSQIRISKEGGISRANSNNDLTKNTEKTNVKENSLFDDKGNDNKVGGYANFAEYKKEVTEFMANFQETFKEQAEENGKLKSLANKLGVEVEDTTLDENDDDIGGYANFAKRKKELSEKLSNYQETFKNLSEENGKLKMLVKINELKSQLQTLDDIKNNQSDDGIKYDGIG